MGAAADARAGAGTAAGAAAHPGVPTERTYASIMTEDQPRLENIIRQKVNETWEEKEEKRIEVERKKNVIITGMDETDESTERQVNRMFHAMGCGFRYHDIRTTPVRLGPNNGKKNRAIRVEMRNEELVQQIMDQKKHLKNKNGDFYHVYVNRDMKREEREKEIKERKERNRRMFGDSAAGAGLRTETNHREGTGHSRGSEGPNPGQQRGAVMENSEIDRELEVENGELVSIRAREEPVQQIGEPTGEPEPTEVVNRLEGQPNEESQPTTITTNTTDAVNTQTGHEVRGGDTGAQQGNSTSNAGNGEGWEELHQT